MLRYHPGEIDDGVNITGGLVVFFGGGTKQTPDEDVIAHIDKFNDHESVLDQDVVVWYSGTFSHDFSLEASHILGPDLVPMNW